MSRSESYLARLRLDVMIASFTRTEAQLQREFRVSRKFARYWARKARDPAFHPQQQGGARNVKFSATAQLFLEAVLFAHLCRKPTLSLPELRVLLSNAGFDVDIVFVSRILQRWSWSKKKVLYKHARKYTARNILYYQVFVDNIVHLPWRSLKFIDEVHFSSAE